MSRPWEREKNRISLFFIESPDFFYGSPDFPLSGIDRPVFGHGAIGNVMPRLECVRFVEPK